MLRSCVRALVVFIAYYPTILLGMRTHNGHSWVVPGLPNPIQDGNGGHFYFRKMLISANCTKAFGMGRCVDHVTQMEREVNSRDVINRMPGTQVDAGTIRNIWLNI